MWQYEYSKSQDSEFLRYCGATDHLSAQAKTTMRLAKMFDRFCQVSGAGMGWDALPAIFSAPPHVLHDCD